MSRYSEGPKSLGETLRQMTARYKKIDLFVIDEILQRWPELVGDMIAQRCTPELVRDHALVVRVPSGAFAERLRMEEQTILTGYADLGERAPTSLKIIIGKAGESSR